MVNNEDWKRACSDFWVAKINNKYPKSKQLQFIKRTNWILPCIVRGPPISKALTFYTDANNSGIISQKI